MNPRNDDVTTDPQVERELEALESALAGRPVDPELADLAALATELRELRETPSDQLAAELDERAAAGFPGPRRGASAADRVVGRLRGRNFRRRLLPALAGATAAVIVGTAVVVSTRDSDEPGENAQVASGQVGEQTVQKEVAPGSGRAALAAPTLDSTARSKTVLPVPPGPPSDGTAPGVRDRQIERFAELTLGTEPEQVQKVSSEVFRVVGRYRGFVLSSSVRDGAEGDAGANFELMIPSSRLSAALADLSQLAEVRSRSESTLDITAPFVSARERLRDARAEAEGLLRELAQADTEAERDSIKAQLRIVRGRIAAFRSQVNRLERRANFSRVSLSLVTGEESAILPSEGGEWGVGDALHDAGRILAVAAAIALVTLAVLLPLALLGAAAWLGRRAYVRRAREAALG